MKQTLDIMLLLTTLYPNCRITCTNMAGSIEEQFNHLIWHDDDPTGINPNPKPTLEDIQNALPDVALTLAKKEMWDEVKKIHTDLSKQKDSDFVIEEEKTDSKKKLLLDTANGFGAQIKAAQTLVDLNNIDYKNGW